MLHSLVVIDRTRDVGLIVYTYNEMTKNISRQFVEHWSEKERWCLGNLTLGSKLPLDVIEICDRSKTISKTGTTKTKDIYVDISDTRFFENRTDGNVDFTTKLVSKGGVYSWYKGSKEDNDSCWRMRNLFLTNVVRLISHMLKPAPTAKSIWNCFELTS